jgi:hypothetical protein
MLTMNSSTTLIVNKYAPRLRSGHSTQNKNTQFRVFLFSAVVYHERVLSKTKRVEWRRGKLNPRAEG